MERGLLVDAFMSPTRLLTLGLSMIGLFAVGCTADAGEEEADATGTDSEEVRSVRPGYCQSADGRTVLGTSCHRKSELLRACQRYAADGEEAWNVTPSNLRQDGKWKNATCSIDARKVIIRCCDAS